MTIFYRIKQFIVLFGDLCCFYIGLYFAVGLRHFEIPPTNLLLTILPLFSLTFFFWIVLNYINGLYDLGSHANKKIFYKLFFETTGFAFILSIIFFYSIPNSNITPKTILVLTLLFGYGLSSFWRLISHKIIHVKQLQSRVLFIGIDKEVLELIQLMRAMPNKGYTPAALIDYTGLLPQQEKLNMRVYKDFKSIRPCISTDEIGMVVISEELKANPEAMRELYELLFWPVQIYHLGAFYEMVTGKIPPSTFSEGWFLEHLRNKERPVYTKVRRLIDLLAAIPLLLITCLFTPIIAVAVRMSSEGNVFFTQQRVGKNGEHFTLYKFRSMYSLASDGSAELDGYEFAQTDDTRITTVGKFIRKTRIDELPQVINLIRGDITLIGPRPERPEIVNELTKKMPYYPLRHVVTPGLTGWAVIHQNYTDTIEKSLKKLQYDLYYIKNRSLLIDISVVLRTINTILRGKGQ